MVNCPECGKPLKKSNGEDKYFCKNSACYFIFVRHPDMQRVRIVYEAKARS